MIKITDKRFHYTPSFNTDLKKKFKRIHREQAEADAKAKAIADANAAEATQKTITLKARKA